MAACWNCHSCFVLGNLEIQSMEFIVFFMDKNKNKICNLKTINSFIINNKIFINMKRLIFFLALFSLTFSATMANHAATTATDMLQKSFVITQITPMPVMAVNFEAAQAVVSFTAVTLPTGKTITVQNFKVDTWRNPDYGPSLIVVSGISTKFNDSSSNIRLNRKLHNYPTEYGFTHNISCTARHV
jgi:hypothetical protein